MNLVYDGSFSGFISAIKKAIEFKDQFITISKEPTLDENLVVNRDENDRLFFKADEIEKLKILFLSEISGFENIAIGVIRKDQESIKTFFQIRERLFKSIRKFKAFLRFKKIREGFYFAVFEPEFNILEFVGNYFKNKMNFDFIIYDAKREIAFISFNKVVKIEKIKINTDIKDEVENLWKKFHKFISIETRKNEKIQKQKIPLKYRKHMTEFHTEENV